MDVMWIYNSLPLGFFVRTKSFICSFVRLNVTSKKLSSFRLVTIRIWNPMF